MFPGIHAAKAPDRPAVIVADSGEVLTYQQLEHASARLARYLRAQGLRRGDVVALIADNCTRVFEIYWATQRAGLYLTAVNHHLTNSERAYIINDSGARALIIAAVKADDADSLLGRCPQVATRIAFGGRVLGFKDYDEVLGGVSHEPFEDQPRGADLLYSSGTTGTPKGIKPALPERQVDEPGDIYVTLFRPMYNFDEDTVYLCPAPLYHAAPLRFSATVQALGGTVVIMRQFDAEAALSAIESFKVTHGQWVPTMFVRLLKLPDEVREGYDVSTLRVAIHAAAPCPVEVKRRMIDWWGPILYEYYASTEANGITFIDSPQWLAKPGSVGKAGLGILRICSDEGDLLPPGHVGLVYFERAELPFRYHNDEAKTASAQHPEHPNWTTTGDVGYVDGDGYLFLTDRKAFVIISGGVNIYPQEIENCLALHPDVLDVAVIGVPDEDMGQVVKAIVQPTYPEQAGPEMKMALIEFVRSQIAPFKAPRTVEFVDSLPRTETGKLQKSGLR